MKSYLKSETASWYDIARLAGDAVRSRVHRIVQAESTRLADTFYEAMFADEDASALLDHQVVNERLRSSMKRWLESLFDPQQSFDELREAQRATGEVHARVGVPMALVSRGARFLKRALCVSVEQADLSGTQMVAAVRYVHELVDLAVDLINAAYVHDENRLTRAEEAYRHLYLNQNLQAERERQRSLLLEWSQATLLDQYLGHADAAAPRATPLLTQSQFGLWLQHKASVIFDGAPELALINERVRELEDHILPDLRAAQHDVERSRSGVAAFNVAIEAIKQHLAALFDLVVGADDAQESVSRLLHRRYLPTVAKREIGHWRRGQTPFAVAILEVEGLDRLVSAFGSESAELVMVQIAAHLSDALRAGDFVFRISESRFAVLIVEVHLEAAESVALALRRGIESQAFRTTTQARVQVSVRQGVAVFDGHPDYQRLLSRAEAALVRPPGA